MDELDFLGEALRPCKIFSGAGRNDLDDTGKSHTVYLEKLHTLGMTHCVNRPAKGEPKTAFVMRLLVADVALSLPD